MAGYFDAFLFSLATVWDMSDASSRAMLDQIESFRFFRALRNVATHHAILAANVAGNKFPRPFSREINASCGGLPNDSSRLFFRMDVLRTILDAIEAERPKEKKNLDVARRFMTNLEAGGERLYLEDVMSVAVANVRAALLSRA